jgi:hypothetical protein
MPVTTLMMVPRWANSVAKNWPRPIPSAAGPGRRGRSPGQNPIEEEPVGYPGLIEGIGVRASDL